MFLQSILASVEQISGTVIGIERTCRRISAELKVREDVFSTHSLVPRSLFGWISLPRIRALAMGMRVLGTPFLINTLCSIHSTSHDRHIQAQVNAHLRHPCYPHQQTGNCVSSHGLIFLRFWPSWKKCDQNIITLDKQDCQFWGSVSKSSDRPTSISSILLANSLCKEGSRSSLPRERTRR